MAPPDQLATKVRLLFISLLVVVLDQWSKWLVETFLDRSGISVVPGFIDLIFVTNTGVAFGLFPAGGRLTGTLLLTALGLGALTVVLLYFSKTPVSQRLLLISLALVLGGAVGNLIDRVMKGAVTDFIDVYVGNHHWPTFNVADSAISIGIALMALESLRPKSAAVTSPEEALES